LDRAQIGDLLALLNAGLNATSAVALFTGYVLIRRRRIREHKRAMVTALTASALFLAFYLTRVAFTGTHELDAVGWGRTLYLVILFSHMVLAVVVAPLVVRLVWLVARRRFRSHARLARWTFPLWAYVSVTGLAVYVLLYQVFGYR
jgi:uncharacterized membrane protein YozB (DUF420 family)